METPLPRPLNSFGMKRVKRAGWSVASASPIQQKPVAGGHSGFQMLTCFTSPMQSLLIRSVVNGQGGMEDRRVTKMPYLERPGMGRRRRSVECC